MIYVNAPIGIGKTSLTKILTKDLGTKGYYENVDDIPMLQDFIMLGKIVVNNILLHCRLRFSITATNNYVRGCILPKRKVW